MSNTNNNMQTQTSSALYNAIMEVSGKDCPPMLALVRTTPESPDAKGGSQPRIERVKETYKIVLGDIQKQLDAEAEVVQIILTGIDNDIYSQLMLILMLWRCGKLLKEFGKFTSRDGETLNSYYSRFYKMINELVKNQCEVTNHQVNVQFLLQLKPELQRVVTLNEVNEIKAERLARTTNPLALVAQQQLVYHPTHYTNNSSTRSQQTTTRNRGKAIVKSPPPTYDQEPKMVAEDDALSKEKEIDKPMALISLSFKKIYKPTNYNLRTSSNTSRENHDNTQRINRGTGYDNQRVVNVVGARENVGT
ncbi:hypothetical protein Tco_1564471 [Tanacetum coccineum]